MNPYEAPVKKIKKLAAIYNTILNKGASAAAIEKFFEKIGLDVPDGFIDFYKVCDGARDEGIVDVQGLSFLPLDHIIEFKQMFDGILEEKQKEGAYFCWHKDWLPFGDDHSYDTLVIDTTGKGSGRKGCIILRSKDISEGESLNVLAPDFPSFIAGWFKRVEEEQVYSFTVKNDDGENEFIDGDDAFFYEDTDSATFTAEGPGPSKKKQ